jgi:hypothetical protein
MNQNPSNPIRNLLRVVYDAAERIAEARVEQRSALKALHAKVSPGAREDDLPDECMIIRDAETRCAKAVTKGDGRSVAEILELLRRVYALQKDLDDFQSEYYAAVGGLRKELSGYPEGRSWRDMDTQQVIALAEHILCLEETGMVNDGKTSQTW